ncbi:hypothetical protein HNP32_003511 [Brevundimonas bullata]|jgi:hypothetical protein|uniref:Uncharacterized protein n=1 Tax=Brevundimonas bullata TaxID=13160 RepID=A0A7W7ISL2_9CAUL|nr:hypothetical protein [Brevundimonas bullata]MBB4799751.1 hypothetical protein [Brevundimonas bullata]MBB6384627.1 hypothetical protein [Brevundimonas bullata]
MNADVLKSEARTLAKKGADFEKKLFSVTPLARSFDRGPKLG